ncbi:MAG TPA: amidohydrolase family protein [Candidatus Limnocylindrales bacterium]|nr:amidohydrolase family protein [Candidatus Limnocylindrales bacterium]
MTADLPERAELLIRGGTIIDGTGAPARAGDVAVVDGRIRILRATDPSHPANDPFRATDPRHPTNEPSGASAARPGTNEDEPLPRAARVIDARGLVVAPGFIDLHSHSGLMILSDPRHEPKVRQGVTTEVIGVDGNSYAPFTDPADLRDFVILNGGLDGRPDDPGPARAHHGPDDPAPGPTDASARSEDRSPAPLAIDWRTVADYLARFDHQVALNIAYVVGNTPLRVSAMGWDDRPAAPQELDRQRGLLREAMEDGAFGLSSGLDYPPGAYATTDELAALLQEAATHGGFYHTHVRYPLGDGFLDPFREALEIGRRSGGGPVHITHFYHRATFPGPPEQMLALVDDARAAGQDVTFDMYPSEWASTRLLILLPTWIQAGGVARLKERLADPGARARIRDELAARGRLYAGDRAWAELRLGAFTRPEHLAFEGQTLAQVMAETGHDAVDTVCDLLLAEDLRVNEVTPGPHLAGMRVFWRHPRAMVGTDSVFIGARPAPRTYGSFPRILGQFVREEQLTSLEEAVRRMTSAPADRLGLADRGRLSDGLLADLVLFDPLRVRSNATYEEPRRYPDGIPYVIVNGTVVVDRGEHTGALPGRALRHRG